MGNFRAGPPIASSIRRAGDETMSNMLAEALLKDGAVERATHGFHAYPARMHPDAAAAVIAACPGPVHDPFCGGGTVLVEAMLAGRQATGTDLSPIAVLVAAARTADRSLVSAMRSDARKITEAARLRVDVEVPELAERWFQPHVAQELGRIRDGIEISRPEVQHLLWALLSSIIVKCSFRKSDTHNRREPHHRAPGTTAILFHKKARELGRWLESMEDGARPQIQLGDARYDTPAKDCGLVLTSPPYPGVYDYLPMQQLRAAWLDLDLGPASGAEVGSRRSFRAKGRKDALKRWREDTHAWIGTQARCLAPGGKMVIVVGDGLVGDRMVDALGPTVEAFQAAGLSVVARASADRPDHAREAVRIEHMVMGTA
jgi:DNA modification methylase